MMYVKVTMRRHGGRRHWQDNGGIQVEGFLEISLWTSGLVATIVKPLKTSSPPEAILHDVRIPMLMTEQFSNVSTQSGAHDHRQDSAMVPLVVWAEGLLEGQFRSDSCRITDACNSAFAAVRIPLAERLLCDLKQLSVLQLERQVVDQNRTFRHCSVSRVEVGRCRSASTAAYVGYIAALDYTGMSRLLDKGISTQMSFLYSSQITANNPAVHQLKLSWETARFTDDDGTGPMASLHQAGDSIVGVAKITESGTVVLGSGVMVAPGILLTATHVLDEFPRSGPGPAFMTFLPDGARVWLPIDLATTSRPSEFHHGREVHSDLSIVSCTLNSDPRVEQPLSLAPMEIALPLLGERLWSIGFRHNDLENDVARLTPLVASGLVTAAYPQGRGDRMPATCIEVAMDTPGGMSGGPVMNSRGNVIGIVSSAFDGGPSYVTLLWDVLRLRVKSNLPWAARYKEVSLISVAGLGSAKLVGRYKKFRRGDVVIQMNREEMRLLVATSNPSDVSESNRVLNDDEIDELLDKSSREIEAMLGQAALAHLEKLSPSSVAWFLSGEEDSGHLPEIKSFQVEDFEGVEDLEVITNRAGGASSVVLSLGFDLLTVIWTIQLGEKDFLQLAQKVQDRFSKIESKEEVVTLQAVQRCYFECDLVYVPASEEFIEATITAHGVHRSKWAD